MYMGGHTSSSRHVAFEAESDCYHEEQDEPHPYPTPQMSVHGELVGQGGCTAGVGDVWPRGSILPTKSFHFSKAVNFFSNINIMKSITYLI